MHSKTPLIFALIGLGHIAKKHLEVLRELGVQGISGYDIDQKQAQFFGETYGIQLLSSLEECIEYADILVLCTPHDTHSFLVKEITTQGKTCVCEKPLGIRIEEFEVFSQQEKSLIIPILQNRLNSAVVQAKSIIKSGKLGKIYHIKGYTQWNRDDVYYSSSSWKGKIISEGGMLYNQGIHNLDTALFLLGYTGTIEDIQILSKTKKRLRNFPIETEDYFSCSLELGDTLYDFSILTYGDRNHHENSLVFYGTGGTLKISGKALNQVEYCDTEKDFEIQLPKENPSDIYGSGHYKMYKMLLAGQKNHLPKFEDGLRMVALLEKLYS